MSQNPKFGGSWGGVPSNSYCLPARPRGRGGRTAAAPLSHSSFADDEPFTAIFLRGRGCGLTLFERWDAS